MLETYKNKNGFALIATTFIVALMLLLGGYLISLTITESKISTSQSNSVKTYYLAESAIAEAIWRIKNDSVWKDGFENNANWHITYTRSPAIYDSGSYTIEIQNTSKANGVITATGQLNIGNSTAQRVVKITAYKALGDSLVEDNAQMADGNVDISGSLFNVYGGSMHANGNIIVNGKSEVTVDKDIKATVTINKHSNSTIVAENQLDKDSNPPPQPVPLPAISFDDPDDPNAYKNQADVIYTKNEFSDLLWNNQNLTLNGIHYVTGDIDIQGGQNLTLNGVLVSDGDIEVGSDSQDCCWNGRCGRSNITISQPEPTSPAGMLSKKTIDFKNCTGLVSGTGLIYSNNQINILNLPEIFGINGGLISRKLTITSSWNNVNVTLNNEVINYTLGDPQFSPVVTVEHWEEEY